MQFGERAPGAANRIERASTASRQPLDTRQLLIGELQRLFNFVARRVDQPQAAERQCDGVLHDLAPHVDEFQAAASKISRDAVGVRKAHANAMRGKLRFSLAR